MLNLTESSINKDASMKRVQPFIPAIGIFCLALVVRFIYNNVVAHNYIMIGDGLYYHGLALALLNQHCLCTQAGIPTVDRPPFWSAVIASIYAFSGPNNYFVRVFLCFVDAGTCVLIYLFAKDVFSRRIGILIGIVAAVYPQLYIYVGWLYSETLYIFLQFAFCYAILRLQRTSAIKWVIMSGILLVLLSFTRPNGLLVFAAFILWAVIVAWKLILPRRFVVKSMLVITLILFIFIAPWAVRNYLITDSFVPIATNDGAVLIGAYNDTVLVQNDVLGQWANPRVVHLHYESHPRPGYPAWFQVEREAAFRQYAVQWMLSHPGNLPFLYKLHFLHMWDVPGEVVFPSDSRSQLFLEMAKTFPFYMYPLAAAGLVLTWKRWRELLFVYLMVLLVTAECLFFYGSARLSSPIQPFLLLLVAGTFWWLTHDEPGTLRWMFQRGSKTGNSSADRVNEPGEPAPETLLPSDQPVTPSTQGQ